MVLFIRRLNCFTSAGMEIKDEDDDFEDDCVVFEGSPLYASLMQSGSLAEELGIELGTSKIISEDKLRNTPKNGAVTTTKLSNHTVFDVVCKTCRMCYDKIRSYLLPDIKSIYIKYKNEMIRRLTVSSCIESDDLDYLQFYIQSQNITNQLYKTMQMPSILYEAIPCLLAIGYCQFTNMNQSTQVWNLSSLISWIFIAAVILKFSISETWKYIHTQKCRNDIANLETFLKQNEQFVSMVKRCLRLIQETELISRGFTFVSHRNPLSHIEGGQKNNPMRQCPVLRKLLFTDCRDGVLYFRDFTKKLLEIYPLCSELDVFGSYLAFEPLQSYGPCLQISEEDDDNKLHDVTDGFAVAALKGINHLFCLHQSEFIKTLVLVLQENITPGTKRLDTQIKQLLVNITLQLEDWTASLQKSHDFYSFDWMKKEPVQKVPKENSDGDAILVALHSLDLHLQAAITRVRAVSEMIEKSSEDKQLLWKPDNLLSKMQPIKAELDSCKGCWEESLNRIEKAAGKFDEGKTSRNEVKLVPEDDSKVVDVKVNEVEDYLIEDQVFEAYTDLNDMQADYDWEKPLTAEEKEKKRREKQEALRMLTELKSVISVRAVETEKREKAAMLKMYPELFANQTTVIKTSELSKENDIEVASDKEFQDKKSSLVQDDESHEDVKDETHFEKKSVCPIDLSCRNIDSSSYVSRQGVRRLRKSNMLDLSDSDLDDNPEESDDNEKNDGNEFDVRPKLGLPLSKAVEYFNSDLVNDELEEETVSNDFVQFRLPAVSLEERLEKLVGAKLGMTADLASQAVAKSKDFGGMDEVTFGGDVYGELSDETMDDNDDDKDNEEYEINEILVNDNVCDENIQ